jgi:hypothetical protein
MFRAVCMRQKKTVSNIRNVVRTLSTGILKVNGLFSYDEFHILIIHTRICCML